MINSIYTNINDSPIRHIKGKVELYDGSTLLQTFKYNDYLQFVEISRIGASGKFFGFGICQQLTVKIVDKYREFDILKNQILKVYFTGDAAETEYVNVSPLFYITTVERDENTNVITIKAYDSLDKATFHSVSELELTPPYCARRFLEAISEKLGLEINLDLSPYFCEEIYHTRINFNGDETLREVLDDLAEDLLSIYYVNNNNQLIFKNLSYDIRAGNPTYYTINKNSYFELKNNGIVNLSNLCCASELGENVVVGDNTGVTQYVRDNAFWETRIIEDAQNFYAYGLSNRLNAITLYDSKYNPIPFPITQFDLNWRGNFLLEIGDRIKIQNHDNSYITSYVLNDVITYNGALSQKTRWEYVPEEAESFNNPVTISDKLSQTSAKVDKANQEITLVASKTDENTSQLSQLKISVDEIDLKVETKTTKIEEDITGLQGQITTNTENISSLELTDSSIIASVSSLNETTQSQIDGMNENYESLAEKVSLSITSKDLQIAIEQERQKGVDKVTTSTGFTFNENGLTIEKSDSEISTNIDEDGLSVFKNDDEVLTADNQGVKAKNLHATTYIVLGNSSYFEEFTDTEGVSRVGCFWMGE